MKHVDGENLCKISILEWLLFGYLNGVKYFGRYVIYRRGTVAEPAEVLTEGGSEVR